ncbi:MAG: FitA-like ribbon-helix-helix domain-containing protein [Microcystis panniformis]
MNANICNACIQEGADMAMLTVRNLPAEVHRALALRAAQRGHSMEAEVRDILATAVTPSGRVRLGALLTELGKQSRLTEEEWTVFDQVRDRTPARYVNIE